MSAAWLVPLLVTLAADDAPPSKPADPSVRRALIVCGLPGDADHRKTFAESVELLYDGLTNHHGFQKENVFVLWPDQPGEKDGPGVKASRGLPTKELLTKTVEEIRKLLGPNDALWVFVL